MRIAFAAAATALLVTPAYAAEVTAQSKIGAVTVFPAGAEVSRVAKVKLEKGEHTLIVQDIAAEAVPGSIRVEGKATGKLEIGSVDSRRLFVARTDAVNAETERRRLEDEIEKLRDDKAVFEAAVQAAETQKTLIGNLAQLPVRPAPPAGQAERGEDWAQILSVIATATTGAQRASLDAQVRMRDIDRKIEDLDKKLASLAPPREERTEVKVFVAAATPLEAEIVVSYQVPNASWTPLYDARLSSGAKSDGPALTLTRRASISQRTGEPWDDASLTLSTTRPTAGASAPELQPKTVDFEQDIADSRYDKMKRRMSESVESMDAAKPAAAPMTVAPDGDALGGRGMAGVASPEPAPVAEQSAVVTLAPFQAVYEVPGRLSVPNTGEAKRVQLLEETIEPQLTVKTVPKDDAQAYLYAKVALPKTSSPLLPGPVSLFRDGTFVGTSSLPVLSPGEDHEVGFGTDDLVRVKHSIVEEKRGETGLISTSRTDSRNYHITVKNMHDRAVQLVIFDQVPVSQNQEIKVELTGRQAPTRQNVDDKRGVLAWDSKLEPDQEQVLDFGYRISWPAAKQIIVK
ncbi:MAG: mucoidy inhibitor MuiA family protein [Hyphomicrobium sp.]